MKKTFTFAAIAAFAIAASAQTESAFMDAVSIVGENATSSDLAVPVAKETTLCGSDNITMKIAWDDSYILQGLGDDNVSINGVSYEMPTGLQGQTNPTPKPLNGGGANTGAVYKFDVATDGVLYVFCKFSPNKRYYVWEGDVENGLGQPVAYTLKALPSGASDAVGYTLPGDEYNWYTIGSGYDNGADDPEYYTPSVCVDIYLGLEPDLSSDYGTTWSSGNALGVLAFPVYQEGKTYFVNATGSKITCNGFVFEPGTETIGDIAFGGGTDGISSVKVAAANADAPVYNLTGQRVGKETKGILIQNGKKFLNK